MQGVRYPKRDGLARPEWSREAQGSRRRRGCLRWVVLVVLLLVGLLAFPVWMVFTGLSNMGDKGYSYYVVNDSAQSVSLHVVISHRRDAVDVGPQEYAELIWGYGRVKPGWTVTLLAPDCRAAQVFELHDSDWPRNVLLIGADGSPSWVERLYPWQQPRYRAASADRDQGCPVDPTRAPVVEIEWSPEVLDRTWLPGCTTEATGELDLRGRQCFAAAVAAKEPKEYVADESRASLTFYRYLSDGTIERYRRDPARPPGERWLHGTDCTFDEVEFLRDRSMACEETVLRSTPRSSQGDVP